MSQLLRSVRLWFVCALAFMLLAFWAGGDFGSNTLTSRTLGDFTTISLVLALALTVWAFYEAYYFYLYSIGFAALMAAIFGGNLPAALHAHTAFFVLAGFNIAYGVFCRVNNPYGDSFTEEWWVAFIATATALTAGPVIYGDSYTEHALVAAAVVVGTAACVRSIQSGIPPLYVLGVLAGVVGLLFSLFTVSVPPVVLGAFFFVAAAGLTRVLDLSEAKSDSGYGARVEAW